MSLKTRVDAAIAEAGWPKRVTFSRPDLSSFPVVATRYSGEMLVAGRHRPAVTVMLVLGSVEDPQVVDGDHEDAGRRLIGVLRAAADSYPELLPAPLTVGAKPFKGGREYAVLTVTVVGP